MDLALRGLFALLLIGAVVPTLRTLHRVGPTMSERLGRAAIAGGSLAAAGLAIGLALVPSVTAGLLSLPWLGMTTFVALARAAEIVAGRRRHSFDQLALAVATAFLAFGAANASANRFGIQPLGFSATIVLLTAVHFHAAGFVLLVAGILTWRRRRSAWLGSAIALLIGGTIVTAFGYALASPALGVGALAVGLAGIGIAAGTLDVGRWTRNTPARVLFTSAAIGLLVSMPLAIAYAVGEAVGLGGLNLEVMVRTHGILNVVAVSLPISLAWSIES